MAFKDLVKACPICEYNNTPDEGQVLTSGDILNKYTCGRCGWYYVEKRQARPTVEVLKGFVNKPLRWEK